MGEYSKALLYHEQSLRMSKMMLPTKLPDSAASYDSIGNFHNNMVEYAQANLWAISFQFEF